MSGRHRETSSARVTRWRRRTASPDGGVFDVAVEEPDLLRADRTARSTRAARAARQGKGDGDASPGRRRASGPSASPMIDPRIAARRDQVAADAAAAVARRRRRRVTGAVAAALVVAAGSLALLSPLVGVRTIEVVGAARTGPEAVRAATELGSGDPLVRVDSNAVTARLRDLPWVRRATLERRWPQTVVVRVEERAPAAIAPCQAAPEGCMVDSSGRVLAPLSGDVEEAAALPRLAGVPAAGDPGSQLPEVARGPLAVAVALPSALRPLVSGVRGEGPEVALDLLAPGRGASPPTVRLGRPERLGEKLTAAATVLARTSANGVAVLDVRVPESPALTRAGR